MESNPRNQGLIPRFNTEALLTLSFYVLAVCCLISYFVWREEHPRLFIYLGVAAAVVRIAFYAFRFFRDKK